MMAGNTDGTLSIVGAGGHGRVIAEAANESGRWGNIEFFDDREFGSSINGFTFSGSLRQMLEVGPKTNQQYIVGFGDNRERLELHCRLISLGWFMATVIHPKSTLSNNTAIGDGSVVMAGVIVNTGSEVAAATILNTGCILDHDCTIAQGVHISPGATLAGNVTVGACGWVGAGATVIHGISIGSNAVLGAGSTAISDIPNNEVFVGSPAQKLKVVIPRK